MEGKKLKENFKKLLLKDLKYFSLFSKCGFILGQEAFELFDIKSRRIEWAEKLPDVEEKIQGKIWNEAELVVHKLLKMLGEELGGLKTTDDWLMVLSELHRMKSQEREKFKEEFSKLK